MTHTQTHTHIIYMYMYMYMCIYMYIYIGMYGSCFNWSAWSVALASNPSKNPVSDMISPVDKSSQRLRSAAHGDLAVSPTRSVHMGPRSFAVSGPTLWNSMPVELTTMKIPLESFKSKLTTYLFTKAYDQWSSWNMCNFLMSTCFSFTRAV